MKHLYILSNNVIIIFYKNRDQESKTGLLWGVSTSGRRKDIRKGYRRVEILYAYVCKWKNETC
jgi:hypothetical protein